MFTKKILYAITALILILPASAQEETRIQVNDFQLTLVPTVAPHVDIRYMPFDAQSFPEQPAHNLLMLYSEPIPMESAWENDGAIRLYNTADFAAYPLFTDELAQLQALLETRPDTDSILDSETLPFLPILTHGSVLHANARYIETDSVSGIAYITVISAAAEPLVTNSFIYVFQGISYDGSTYIVATFPVTNALYPANAPEDFNWDAFYADINGYMANAEIEVNALADDSFSPSLSEIDRLLGSFTIES